MNINADMLANRPEFDFAVPHGYWRLLERGVVGYDVSGLEPWYYLDKHKIFSATDFWPQGPHQDRLIAFARRYDTDDIACFAVKSQITTNIVVIHGWTSAGYDIVAIYESFWAWLKSVIDDIADVVDSAEGG